MAYSEDSGFALGCKGLGFRMGLGFNRSLRGDKDDYTGYYKGYSRGYDQGFHKI